jgi:hypothetical protein
MNLKVIDTEFSVCKVEDYSQVDLNEEFVFAGHTDEELSLVCPTSLVPDNTTECNDGWKAFRIEGVLDFSLVGILSRISTCLADNSIGIFAISTFNTDYILIKDGDFEKAIEVLELAGYTITKYHKTTL